MGPWELGMVEIVRLRRRSIVIAFVGDRPSGCRCVTLRVYGSVGD